MNEVRNIVFDLDGTLVDSADGVVAAVNYSLEKVGLPVQSPETIKEYIGYPLSVMYARFTDIPPRELTAHFQAKAAETVVASTVVMPGADDVLEILHRRGYRLAIASTKIAGHIRGILERFGWTGCFHTLCAGDEVTAVKPDPEILRLALSRLDAEPAETLVVGDTENDILAAHAIGIRAVGVRSPYGGEARLKAAGPDVMIDSITDLPALLPGADHQ